MVKVHLDFRLFDPKAELSALRRSMATLETQLAQLTKALTAEADEQISAMSREDYEHGEAQLVRQELEYETKYTLPRVYRAALLLLIWSAYESGIQEVAEFLSNGMASTLDISDMAGRTVLDKAKRFFPGVLSFQLFSDGDAKAQLGELEKVRNAISHASGRLIGLRPAARKAIEAMITSGRIDEGLGWIILPQPYLSSAMDLVESELTGLITRALEWDDSREGRSSSNPESD